MPACDRCEIRERQSGYRSVCFATYSQGQIHYCYTYGLLCLFSQVLSIITCSRIARHGYPPGDLLLPYRQFTLCRACLDEITCVAVMYLTLRTVCERHGRKNPLPFPFSKRSHVGNLRQTIQGKGRSSKRKENRRLSFLFAPAAGAATLPRSADGESPAEVQRKTLRPLGANTLTQFARPGQPMQEKEPPRQGEPACGSSCSPVIRCRK